jgi:zinc protease
MTPIRKRSPQRPPLDVAQGRKRTQRESITLLDVCATIAPLAALATVLTLTFATGFGRTVSAQETATTSPGLVRKGKVPVSNEILKIKLPRPAEAELPNGLRLIVLEDHRLPQISFQVIIPGAGGFFDPAEQPGLASFTASLMREGTSRRTSNQISAELDLMAATLTVNAGSTSTEASMNGSALSEQVSTLFDLAADVLLHPAFPEEEVARFKQRTRNTLAQQRSNPNFLAAEMFARAIYGSHPAARIAPTVASLDRTTREQMVDFHRSRYVPDRAVLAVAGDISLAQAKTLAESTLGAWKKSSGPIAAPIAEPAPLTGSKIYFVARPNSVQTNLIVGTQAIERTNPDYDALQVLNKVIGGGPTGRLFLHLREDKGYTYGASSVLDARQHRGDWAASTNVRTEVTEPALRDLLDEIRQLREVPVPERELADAKRSMIASFALSLESPAQLLGLSVTAWRYKLPGDYWDRYAERITAVTSAQLQALARKYLAAERLEVVAVGDPGPIAGSLKKLGVVEAYDANGTRLQD